MNDKERQLTRRQRIKMAAAFISFVVAVPVLAVLSSDASHNRQESDKAKCISRGAVTGEGEQGAMFNSQLDADCLKFITPTVQRQELVHGDK